MAQRGVTALGGASDLGEFHGSQSFGINLTASAWVAIASK